MRLASFLVLFPAFAVAQDIPSLQRPGASLPLTDSIPLLRARLGGPGGPFAAAQLSLKGATGTGALFSVRNDPDPLKRLDAVYGLGLVGTDAGDFAAAWFLGDSDVRVADEAEHGFRLAGARARLALRQAAYAAPERSAAQAAAMLVELGQGEWAKGIARDPAANGRGGAIRALDLPLPVYEAATHDRRIGVRFEAARKIVFGPKTPEREAALDRLSRDADSGVRLALVRAMDEDPGSSLDMAYERAQRYGPPGSRRVFARMVAGNLYDPARLLDATAVLARLANDPVPSVADAAIDELAQFLEDRLGSGSDGSSGPGDAEDVPWNRLPPQTAPLLRRAAARRLTGPQSFKAAIILARLRDSRAYPILARLAFDPREDQDTVATLALGELRDRRATRPLLHRVEVYPGDFVAFDALGRLGDSAAIPSLLGFVQRHEYVQNSSISAAYALAAIGDRAAVPAFIRIIRADPGIGVNYFVPLARLGGPEAGRFLLDRLVNGPEDRVQYAALGLGQMRDPGVVTELKRLVESHHPRAKWAEQALYSIARRTNSS